jgi:NADPH-dependent curcumin reductase CurA
MAEAINREIRLKQRPVGMPQESDFELIEAPIPEPAEGELLVRVRRSLYAWTHDGPQELRASF